MIEQQFIPYKEVKICICKREPDTDYYCKICSLPKE